MIYSKMKHFNKAIESFRRCIYIDPLNAEFFNMLGIVYMENSKVEQAVTAFISAVEVDPKHLKAHYNLGIAYMEMGFEKDAMREYYFLKQEDTKLAEQLREYIKLNYSENRIS